jgi:hypothetical protein
MAALASSASPKRTLACQSSTRQRQVTITANVAPGFGAGAVLDALDHTIAREHMAAAYLAMPAGNTREQSRVTKAFGVAIGLTAIFMYLVLAARFGSWLPPCDHHAHDAVCVRVALDIQARAFDHVGAGDHRSRTRTSMTSPRGANVGALATRSTRGEADLEAITPGMRAAEIHCNARPVANIVTQTVRIKLGPW